MMSFLKHKLVALLTALLFVFTLAGCSQETAETAGEKVDEAAEKAGETIDQASDTAEETLETAKEKLKGAGE